MSKFTKPLALGFATAFLITSSAAALACAGQQMGQNGQGPTYGQNQQSMQGNQAGRQLGSRYGAPGGQGGQGQYRGNPGGQLGQGYGGPQGPAARGPRMQQSTSDSIIFEIVGKDGCTTEACTSLTLQDAYGHRIQIGSVEFDEALTADATLEELIYHLAQNGSALKGRLELGGQEGDRERTYNLLVEKIYS